MNQYLGLDTLMASNGINSAEAFTAYYVQVLSRRESQNLNVIGFEEWGIPRIEFTYKMLEAEQKISVMATYVDLNSDPIPIGTKGFRTLEGQIPRQKARFELGENDYRKQLIVLKDLQIAAAFTNQSPETSVKNYLAELLFGGLSEIQDAHINSMSYAVGQMKSQGQLTLTDANNPRGIQSITFSAQIPAANKTTLEGNYRWFTNDDKTAEGSSSDPVKDLKTRVRNLRDKLNGGSVTVEVNETSFFEDMQHSKWQVAIGYAMSPDLIKYAGVGDDGKAAAAAVAASAGDDAIKAAFRKAINADEVIFNKTVCGVEKYNKSTKQLEIATLPAFDKNTYLVRPSGKVGIRENVVPLRPDPSAISAMIFEGHGIIEYRYDARTKYQDWVSELTVLPVPTRPSDMYILHTK